MPSFSIPLTGLESQATALNTIANNLANMSTTAYKSQSVSFSDLFYQQIGNSGAGDPELAGAGVQVSGISANFTQGSISSTGTTSNVAIDGDGFFVVDSGGVSEYTRDGNFSLSSTGELLSSDGGTVMGYPATNGVVNTNAPLTSLTVPVGEVEQAKSTTTVETTANLDSDAVVGTVVPLDVKVYDSLGEAHTITINCTKTANNSWTYSASLESGAASGSSNVTGTLTFDSNGNLTSPSSNVTGMNFTGMSDGASDLSFTWNLYPTVGSSSPLTQVAATSALSASSQDGYASGQYQSYAVNSDGSISVTFSNGNSIEVGQIALAMVNNEQGLDRVGSNTYATTLASGSASVGVAGAGGRGTLESSSLEGSNVDVSTEFSQLIVAQRAYEANSKAITTFDQVTEQTINMIH